MQRSSDRLAWEYARFVSRRSATFFELGAFEALEGLGIREAPISQLTLREIEANARITVQSLRYENPLELVILAGGVVVVYIIRLIRDWPARRRINNAAATEYENAVAFRQKFRDRLLDSIDKGELPLTPELIDSLLTDDVANALSAVADADLKVLGLPTSSPDKR
ncbi:hypothetical protein SAMN04515691_3432 [Leifsonia sp. 98AMF]|nr:hypothetical protein SAMN04515690_0585 [Leifsonia sp. 197AMF]SDJ32608.1 hypothetical protein SAMN04515684_3198 [Leifsonia sp. 466MF]SDK47300.1 hypothetical protein SAMN04515683_3567 [Leifsonia sp. 157MF]SDN53732.1 hypothetical protein SAMN04515686_1383 [Leifsonia sp. 509MF]SEN56392.1 hypothetical protein SAMN04515685_3549 [Leifsonia sp. 467MF]SFM72894.1 hypothetical protein SAMN04515691_3432 [Leifsonia sp. 98AMF]